MTGRLLGRRMGATSRPAAGLYLLVTNHTGIRFGVVNARSVIKKIGLIHDVISGKKLNILAITETWVRGSEPNTIKKDLAPPG